MSCYASPNGRLELLPHTTLLVTPKAAEKSTIKSSAWDIIEHIRGCLDRAGISHVNVRKRVATKADPHSNITFQCRFRSANSASQAAAALGASTLKIVGTAQPVTFEVIVEDPDTAVRAWHINVAKAQTADKRHSSHVAAAAATQADTLILKRIPATWWLDDERAFLEQLRQLFSSFAQVAAIEFDGRSTSTLARPLLVRFQTPKAAAQAFCTLSQALLSKILDDNGDEEASSSKPRLSVELEVEGDTSGYLSPAQVRLRRFNKPIIRDAPNKSASTPVSQSANGAQNTLASTSTADAGSNRQRAEIVSEHHSDDQIAGQAVETGSATNNIEAVLPVEPGRSKESLSHQQRKRSIDSVSPIAGSSDRKKRKKQKKAKKTKKTKKTKRKHQRRSPSTLRSQSRSPVLRVGDDTTRDISEPEQGSKRQQHIRGAAFIPANLDRNASETENGQNGHEMQDSSDLPSCSTRGEALEGRRRLLDAVERQMLQEKLRRLNEEMQRLDEEEKLLPASFENSSPQAQGNRTGLPHDIDDHGSQMLPQPVAAENTSADTSKDEVERSLREKLLRQKLLSGRRSEPKE